MNKILIFLIFPVFSGFSSLFTFLHFSLILAYFGISLHIFVINFGKNFGKFQVCTKGKSAIGNRQDSFRLSHIRTKRMTTHMRCDLRHLNLIYAMQSMPYYHGRLHQSKLEAARLMHTNYQWSAY